MYLLILFLKERYFISKIFNDERLFVIIPDFELNFILKVTIDNKMLNQLNNIFKDT